MNITFNKTWRNGETPSHHLATLPSRAWQRVVGGHLTTFGGKLTLVIIIIIASTTLLPALELINGHNSNQTGGEELLPAETVLDGNDDLISPFSALLKSALIPGWGEIGMGSSSGYAFLAMEFFLWAGRFYFQEEVNLYEQDSYHYALRHADLNPGDYDDDFLHKLTRYNSSGFEPGGYNEHIFREAQNRYPDDEEARNKYVSEHAILDDELFWSWEDRDKRRIYSIKRKNADHNRDYVKFVTGAIVANHIISAINSLRLANQRRRQQRVEFSIDLSQPKQPAAKVKVRF